MGSVTPLITARALSPSWRHRLASSLKIQMDLTVHHPDSDPWPTGAVDYRATFRVSWDAEEAMDAEEVDARILTGLADTATKSIDDSEHFEAAVGRARLLVADLMVTDLCHALDARSGDAAYVGETVLDIREGGLNPDLLEQVEGFASRLLIVENVEIAPAWQGLKLGLIGTGLTLQHLAPGSAVVALHAMQPGLEDEHERTASHRRLTGYWQRLGFQPFRHEVLVLDLAMVYLDESMKQILAATH